jgi:hypothetical protein
MKQTITAIGLAALVATGCPEPSARNLSGQFIFEETEFSFVTSQQEPLVLTGSPYKTSDALRAYGIETDPRIVTVTFTPYSDGLTNFTAMYGLKTNRGIESLQTVYGKDNLNDGTVDELTLSRGSDEYTFSRPETTAYVYGEDAVTANIKALFHSADNVYSGLRARYSGNYNYLSMSEQEEWKLDLKVLLQGEVRIVEDLKSETQ